MAKGKTLRGLSAKEVAIGDSIGIAKELRGVSDRSAAIVLASMVERDLEQLIVQVLPKKEDEKAIAKLQERDGALNSFFGKIHLGYALGLYDEKTRDNLDTIRQIRNAFAHTAQGISFETQEIREAVDGLHGSETEGEPFESFSEQRRKFMSVCGLFVTMVRFKPIGKKLGAMAAITNAIQPHLSADKNLPDLVEKLSKAVEAIKALERKHRSE
jgi:hypothetical protein